VHKTIAHSKNQFLITLQCSFVFVVCPHCTIKKTHKNVLCYLALFECFLYQRFQYKSPPQQLEPAPEPRQNQHLTIDLSLTVQNLKICISFIIPYIAAQKKFLDHSPKYIDLGFQAILPVIFCCNSIMP